jgi:cysteinyl-tRNA synthetase, unknown class
MERFKLPAAVLAAVLCGCASPGAFPSRDFRQDMRDFVQAISAYARAAHPGFVVIPQDGPELASSNGDADGPADSAYLAAVDGIGKEDLFYGYNADDAATPAAETEYACGFLDIFKTNGKQVLITDYCWTASKVDDSYTQNDLRGYVSFAAGSRGLDHIPAYPAAPYASSTDAVATLSGVRNYLYLIDPTNAYAVKSAFVDALDATDYDLFVVDLFHGAASLSPADIARLRTKPGGSARLVVCYMSIGEAEDYRWYWQPSWSFSAPRWLDGENPDWAGNYKVHYWDPAWQAIIFGSPDAYLDRIIAAGFDGVYLDIVNAFEYYEGD